jgi:hypothetical protein
LRDVSWPLVRGAVIVGDHLVIVGDIIAGFLATGFLLVVALIVTGLLAVAGFLTIVAGFLLVVALIVAGLLAVTAFVVAAVAVTAVVIAAVAATFAATAVVVIAAVAATFAVAAVVIVAVTAITAAAIAIAALATFGEGLGHSELDVVVDVEGQSGRQTNRKRRHGGGLQQPAQAMLADLAFIPHRRRRKLLARNRVHRLILLIKRAGRSDRQCQGG